MALLNPLERQKQAYENYAKNRDNRGLGAALRSLFAAEGPEAAGTFVNIPGADFSPGGRMSAITSLADNLDFKDQDALENYLQNISERTIGRDGISIPVEGLVSDEGGFFGGGGPFLSESGQQFGFGEDLADLEKARREIQDNAFKTDPIGNLTQKALLEKQAAESDIAAREALGEEGAFQPSGLDEITDILSSIDNAEPQPPETSVEESADGIEEILKEITGSGRGKVVEKPGERKAYMDGASSANQKILSSMDPVLIKSLEESYGESVTNENLNDAFAAAMKDREIALGETPPKKESKSDALERYKKEFEEATGIDASGKVDKSRALMAFGLALMQNKAGKGFNVGKMLQSVASAGESALPALDKATADAKAAQLAAGKYALNQRQSDVDAQLASAAAAKDFKQKVYLKWYESSLKREEENLKSQSELLKIAAENGGSDYDKKHEFEFTTGQTSFKIPVVYDKNSPSAGIILKPDPYARKYIDGRAGVEDALDVISTMRSASQAIADGGGTTKFAYDRMNSIAKALFPDLNTGEPSSEQEYAQGVNLIMGRFKRFLTQETGNGISNRDVEIWENEIMKKPGWFTNFDETASALDQLEDIFRSKLGEFDAGIDFIYDEANLLPGDYEKLVEKYGDVSQIQGNTGKLVFKDGRIVRSQ